ncbi:MAG: hypothetical protein Q9226_009080, partial [Calogaya cf. arnoldii]
PEAAVADEDGLPPTVPVDVPPPPSGTPLSTKVLDALAEADEIDEENVENGSDDVVESEREVGNVPENEEEYEVEFDVGEMVTGKVVTIVEPEIVCDEVTTRL